MQIARTVLARYLRRVYQTALEQVQHYGYRYYSPEIGRWMSRDPIGE
jgi:RHS repeat-associated protein